MKPMIDKIPLILNSTQSQLQNLAHVESLIKEFGLFNDPRNIYGESYNAWVNWLDWKNGLYQQPRQLSETLIYISNKNVKSYLDIGTFNGYTFTFIASYLSKFGLTRATALDPNKYFDKYFEVESTLSSSVSLSYYYNYAPIQKMGYKESWIDWPRTQDYDLVFIDGNHDYQSVKSDYENFGKHAKYCAFHDINDEYVEKECPGGGVPVLWRELIGKKTEFLYHPDNKRIMGIGVIEHA
jgi:hypothetical protein